VKTVLLVDHDLGFVFWLGQTLDRAGYEALPAKDVAGAAGLIDELHLEVDLLIIEAALSGAAGFVEKLCHDRPTVKVIAVSDPEDNTDSFLPGANAFRKKPALTGPADPKEWLSLIEELIVSSSSAG
jgi:DNA-binding response OmpR family regulator